MNLGLDSNGNFFEDHNKVLSKETSILDLIARCAIDCYKNIILNYPKFFTKKIFINEEMKSNSLKVLKI